MAPKKPAGPVETTHMKTLLQRRQASQKRCRHDSRRLVRNAGILRAICVQCGDIVMDLSEDALDPNGHPLYRAS